MNKEDQQFDGCRVPNQSLNFSSEILFQNRSSRFICSLLLVNIHDILKHGQEIHLKILIALFAWDKLGI